ncbi:MAG: ATP-binding protein [Kiritimatiellaeota bacterium]|nr:ATP-binding protein [Kiritimatiellota bacterium]
MKKKNLFYQFFGVHILILIAAISFATYYTWFAMREAFNRQWLQELDIQTRVAATVLLDADGALDETAVSRFFAQAGDAFEHRFTLVRPDGKVLGDTEANAASMDSHADRPEIQEALKNGTSVQRRYSTSLGKSMLYLAHRVPAEGPAAAVVRVAVPEFALMREIAASGRTLLVLVTLVIAAAVGMGYVASLRIIGPVSALQSGLRRIGDGELTFRLAVPAVPHLAELAKSINQTADRIAKQIHDLAEERNLRTLILANMARGVIAADVTHTVKDINAAARNMTGFHAPLTPATRIGEVIRHPDLLRLIDDCERAQEPIERETTIGPDGEMTVTARVTPLNDTHGQSMGTLIIINDVTHLRKLETVRQDFVANVSHELRTPITSIKGFAETLLDGAKDDPATAERFLTIITRQANQLEAIIHDLLDLSRLEQNSAQGIEKAPAPLAAILRNAAGLCQDRANARGIRLNVTCDPALTPPLHAGLIEQALVNLIDNAIKYGATPERPQVDITATATSGAAEIRVRDHGNGIDKPHLDRLFERFYRVDKGRSREMGGTGLGLAIVKHITLVHGGTVTVESDPARGTTFTLHLPFALAME